jgi:hypothetical protein
VDHHPIDVDPVLPHEVTTFTTLRFYMKGVCHESYH